MTEAVRYRQQSNSCADSVYPIGKETLNRNFSLLLLSEFWGACERKGLTR